MKLLQFQCPNIFYFSLLTNNEEEGDKLIENQTEGSLAETKKDETKKIRSNSDAESESSDEETNSQVVSQKHWISVSSFN